MLLLFETAAGFALFKVLKEGKLENAEVRQYNLSLVGSRLRSSAQDRVPRLPQPLRAH